MITDANILIFSSPQSAFLLTVLRTASTIPLKDYECSIVQGFCTKQRQTNCTEYRQCDQIR